MTERITEKDDLVTIGVTEQGDQIISKLLARGWFETDLAAFKAAVAYAIANDIPPTVDGRFQTKWNVGSLDRSGEFIEVVSLYTEGTRPWDLVRRLGDAALKALGPDIERVDVPSDIFLRRATND